MVAKENLKRGCGIQRLRNLHRLAAYAWFFLMECFIRSVNWAWRDNLCLAFLPLLHGASSKYRSVMYLILR
jgi:hypothetical protein